MTVRTVPIFIDGNTHPAEETRQALGSLQGTATGSFAGGVGAVDRAHGVVNVNDFAVTRRSTGANMSVDVAAGYAWIRGTENANQGAYHVYNDATVNLSVATADATNPRVDLVIIRVQDAFYSGATRTASVAIVTGTPAANPADPTLPANSLVLARIYVPANAAQVINVTETTANSAIINDLRTRVASGSESYNRTGFKNAVMNGDFRINQRGLGTDGKVGGVLVADGGYGFDRWRLNFSGGTVTYSAQTFTSTSPVAVGYEPANYAQIAVSGQGVNDYACLTQVIEDVRTFAGGQVTISFWAKATTASAIARAKIGVAVAQNFGSGGSPSQPVYTPAGVVTIDQSTSFKRYSVTVNVPSLSGKTIGSTANTSGLELRLYVSAGSSNATHYTPSGSLGAQANTFQFWGVQVERGSFPTAFEERPLATELQLVQRYYVAICKANDYPRIRNTYWSSNNHEFPLSIPTEMRVTPVTVGSPRSFSSAGGNGSTLNSWSVLNQSPGCVMLIANLSATDDQTLAFQTGAALSAEF